ncbi:SDR family NAD(P)-dependent oxidoreductase [Bradyrhizobium sediminis]|uniref:SDR family NAD(P)-dependent oxidoreductase n=1 Tax=Bradyrhizobium sediminis TaxID=2840469 RepID=A0A975RLQ3_9BRAD|nr:SDR family NAD(P)-dependent oxidoreductase [Bradyrhizobium sediminis]QWG11878.1 SDR family NAD(P)-dependent oxidoreductase [Bradyrhizobium sediminis]
MNARDRLPVCAIVGVGPGNGAALARRFASEGYAVAMLARTTALTEPLAAELPGARSYPCDVTDAAAVQETFARVARELGAVDVLVYNAGKGVWGAAADVSPEDFEECWRVNGFGAFLAARAVIPADDILRLGQHHLHWSYGLAAWRRARCGVCFGESRPARTR